jgi:potassium-transporting ATPase KdpC subunit
MLKLLRTTTSLLVLMTALTGIAYPLVVTGLAQLAFPTEANGSLVREGDRPIGSSLIGQAFTDPKYFWGRPSATATPYDGRASSGSNLGPTNPALTAGIKQRIATLSADGAQTVPVDLVTASGSGLDPHLSPAGARYQVQRIAKLRGVSDGDLVALIERLQERPIIGTFGEPRINVLALNRALDALQARQARDGAR